MRARKSFVLPSLSDRCKITITGDSVTSKKVKTFLASTPCHKSNETMLLLLERGIGDKEEKTEKADLHLMDLEEIYNDAEFDVLFTTPQHTPPDRDSILKGIHGAVVEGASWLRQTLQTYTTPSNKIVATILRPSDKKIDFPYQQLWEIRDQDQHTVYCMLSPSLKPVASFSYFTQITMGIPIPHVLFVLRVITKELLDNKGTNGLHQDDEKQLEILPEAELEVQKVMEKGDPLYDITVLMVYWIRTKPNRKASPFLIRHHMVQ